MNGNLSRALLNDFALAAEDDVLARFGPGEVRARESTSPCACSHVSHEVAFPNTMVDRITPYSDQSASGHSCRWRLRLALTPLTSRSMLMRSLWITACTTSARYTHTHTHLSNRRHISVILPKQGVVRGLHPVGDRRRFPTWKAKMGRSRQVACTRPGTQTYVNGTDA